MRASDEAIKKTIDLARFMVELAEEGDRVREDSGCGALYGVLRDSGYKIMRMAGDERERHIRKGWWK